jgi:drug/metabolite transporter (DMT)-like permease
VESAVSRQLPVLVAGVVAISCAAVLVRLAGAPPLFVAAGRLVIASVVLLPLCLVSARREFIALFRQRWRPVVLAGTLLAAHFALWIASLSYTTVASSVVLVTTTPFIVALASYFLFGERLRRATFAGMGICLAGAALIGYAGWRQGGAALSGNALAFLAALAISGYLLVGRRLRRTANLLPYSTAVFSVAGALLALALVATGTGCSGYPSRTYAAVLALALVPQLVGHMSLNWALRFLPATMVTVAVLGEPVGASVLAVVVLHETPALPEVAGAALILAGIALAFLRGGSDR